MRSMFACALLMFASAVPGAAQVFLGAEAGPDVFSRQDEARVDTSGEDAFAWAVSAEVSTRTLYSVFESTSPEREILKYLRQGIYRQELSSVLLLAEKTSVPFRTLAAELAKGGSFRALARKHKADAMALFEAGARLKEAAELRMPIFLAVSASTAAPAGIRVSTPPPSALNPDAEK